MKLLSRLFRKAPPPPPAPVAVEPLPPAAPEIDPEEQQQLLRTIESGAMESAELVRLAVEGRTTRLRQAAAAAIHEPALWQGLLPRLRGRDKEAYKLIKQRLDAVLAATEPSFEVVVVELPELVAGVVVVAVEAPPAAPAPALSTVRCRPAALSFARGRTN